MSRGLLGFLLAFVLTLLCAPIVRTVLTRRHVGQPILGYVDTHAAKQGTPTMGGILFLVPIAVTALSLRSGSFHMTLVSVAAMLGYGLIGFLDDFIKVHYGHNKGLAAYQKLLAQCGLAALTAWYCYRSEWIGGTLWLPITGRLIDIGVWIIPLSVFVMLAVTNAVNLTDGLDGLAGSSVLAYCVPFSAVLVALLVGARDAGEGKAYLDEIANLLLFVCAIAGAMLGFLLHNSHPARIFMGDTGSLALGGAVGISALCTRTTLLLPIFGIVFLWSALSVILQVISFKLTKRRIFLMAPYHHHLERKGWSEPRVCALYATVTLVVGALYAFVALYCNGVT